MVDAERFPKWTASDDFIPLAESDKALPDYPAAFLHGMPDYPGVDVLGWLTASSGSNKNWLVQLKHSETLMLIR